LPASKGSTKSAERLRRLLVVVPYLVQHPGTKVEEMTRLFNVPERQLLADLNLLFVSGLPPYGPGDLIDVDIEEGRIWVRMADYFARPLRLTRSEALALYLRGKELLAAPGLPEARALESALSKLEDGLGQELLGELSGRVEAEQTGEAAETLEALRQAVTERQRLEIEYYSASLAENHRTGRAVLRDRQLVCRGVGPLRRWRADVPGRPDQGGSLDRELVRAPRARGRRTAPV
jgi:proteasome accessory factor C